jgi:hypothetical protein
LEDLGREVGHPLNFTVVSEERMIRASVAGMDGDLAPMTRIVAEAADPAKIEQLSKAIAFLDGHKNVLDWNNAYLATSTPGQTYSGQLVSRSGEDFMLREDRGMIIIGRVADLPDGVKPPQRMTFTASDPKIPASGFWERQTVERMALDLREGVSPDEVVRTWAKWHPQKGNEAYFTGLVERALPEGTRKAWIDRSTSPAPAPGKQESPSQKR